MAYDAVLRNLEIIGEAAKGIPFHVRDRYPDVDWRGTSGLRDILVHAYFGLDNETLFPRCWPKSVGSGQKTVQDLKQNFFLDRERYGKSNCSPCPAPAFLSPRIALLTQEKRPLKTSARRFSPWRR